MTQPVKKGVEVEYMRTCLSPTTTSLLLMEDATLCMCDDLQNDGIGRSAF
jgi:hypothetical protein